MERLAMDDLKRWKNSASRKPLILQGARQVGKTWLALEFGRCCFAHTAHIVFLDNAAMKEAFGGSLDPARLLSLFSAEVGQPVGDENTLIVLDEIQECPRVLTALKLFCEQRPEVPIIAAGSLLGVAIHEGVSFPVGKVDFLNLHPLSFQEFLTALGENSLAEALALNQQDVLSVFKEKLTDFLRQYYVVGGMPEAVAAFLQSGDFTAARNVQENLLLGYENDFSKHATPLLASRIREVWRSAPLQLARENKKFMYSAISQTSSSHARARGYKEAISWLIDSGLLIRVQRIKKPGLPLAAYADSSSFKLYFLDVGLLGAASGLDPRTLIGGSRLFQEFKGSLTEQFVCQELIADGRVEPYYWSAQNSSGEVDFVYSYKNHVVAIEVKASENLRSPSLHAFCEKHGLLRAIRLSLAGFKDQGWMLNLPLYATGLLPEQIEQTFEYRERKS